MWQTHATKTWLLLRWQHTDHSLVKLGNKFSLLKRAVECVFNCFSRCFLNGFWRNFVAHPRLTAFVDFCWTWPIQDTKRLLFCAYEKRTTSSVFVNLQFLLLSTLLHCLVKTRATRKEWDWQPSHECKKKYVKRQSIY